MAIVQCKNCGSYKTETQICRRMNRKVSPHGACSGFSENQKKEENKCCETCSFYDIEIYFCTSRLINMESFDYCPLWLNKKKE